MTLRQCTATLALLLFALPAAAGDRAQFRGPQGNGQSTETGLPTTWGPDQNIKWKVKLPQPGNSSPIVSAGRVFLTCAQDSEGKQRSLYCFDRANGKELWVKTVDFDKVMQTHKTNPYCASTPAADGKRVVAWHGSAGIFCYDFEGNQLWNRDLGEFQHQWGYASSPVIVADRVLLNAGPGKRVFVTALDLDTGKTLWEQDEPAPTEGPKLNGSWATPIVIERDGKQQAVVAMPTRVVSYDVQTGNILWWCEGLSGPRGHLAYSSPIITKDLLMDTGGYSGPGFGMKLGGSGDVTESNRLWRVEKNPQSIGTGVFVDGYVYRPNAGPGTIDCIDPKTGDVVWSKRAAEGANYWGSMIHADGRIYVTNQRGTTVVFKPNPEDLEVIATNELRESSNATPAVSDGQIFLRTDQQLYCVGE